MYISIESDADLHHPSPVREIGLGIAAGIDLLKGMLRRAHLLVGNGQMVGLNVCVVVLDREVPALIEQWQRILHVLSWLFESRCRHLQGVERGDLGIRRWKAIMPSGE